MSEKAASSIAEGISETHFCSEVLDSAFDEVLQLDAYVDITLEGFGYVFGANTVAVKWTPDLGPGA